MECNAYEFEAPIMYGYINSGKRQIPAKTTFSSILTAELKIFAPIDYSVSHASVLSVYIIHNGASERRTVSILVAIGFHLLE